MVIFFSHGLRFVLALDLRSFGDLTLLKGSLVDLLWLLASLESELEVIFVVSFKKSQTNSDLFYMVYFRFEWSKRLQISL